MKQNHPQSFTHNARLAARKNAVFKAIERNQRKTFKTRIAGNLATLAADIHKEVEPQLATMRAVDSFIASGSSLMAFARGIVRDVSPWKTAKDATKPALPVGMMMPPNICTSPRFSIHSI